MVKHIRHSLINALALVLQPVQHKQCHLNLMIDKTLSLHHLQPLALLVLGTSEAQGGHPHNQFLKPHQLHNQTH